MIVHFVGAPLSARPFDLRPHTVFRITVYTFIMNRSLIAVLIVLTFPFFASAHEPEYIATSTVIHIPDPDISRAYYGELPGSPAVFDVRLTETTNFYMNLLSPDIPGARTDFSAIMTNPAGDVVISLSGGTWEQWYEEFGGDTYLKGPETRTELPAGAYTITVSNPDNSGKYVLAPGEEEVFTVAGTPRTIREMYLMKTAFFNKPAWTLFQGVIGYSLLGITVAVVLLVGGALYMLMRRRAL